MKQTIAYFILGLFLVLSTGCNTFAQETEQKPFIYGQFGPEGGNYVGITIAGTYVFPSKYVVQVGYQFLISNAEERPSDYQIGALDVLSLGLTAARDNYNIFHASFGKIFELTNHPKTRFNLMGGVGYAAYSYATNFESSGGIFVVSNYTFDTKNSSAVFLLIQPKIEFCLSQHNGISIGPIIKLSERENLFGFSVNYIFGKLRNKVE